MPITVGNGAGQYPPTIAYLANGEPADDITFNRPHGQFDDRTEAIRAYVDALGIANVAGLAAALAGAAPLNANLIGITTLDYGANLNKIFSINGSGQVELIPNTLQGEINTGESLGAGSEVFKDKTGLVLRFRSLVAGTNVTLQQNADDIVITSAPGEISRLTKSVKNTTGVTIAAGSVVAWADDGTILLADANIHDLSDICGITLAAIPDAAFGLVAKLGAVPGILAGLGATPGDWVYLSGTPGALSLTAPTALTDTIVALGRAEPPDGVATASADDLFLNPTYVAEGGVA